MRKVKFRVFHTKIRKAKKIPIVSEAYVLNAIGEWNDLINTRVCV